MRLRPSDVKDYGGEADAFDPKEQIRFEDKTEKYR